MTTSKDNLLSQFSDLPLDTVPIWFMRQAGRYLPEYRKFREGKTFEDMAMTPEYAMEVTLQPIGRFDLDAAIIFSDILIPLYGMDRGLSIVPNVGPVFENPVKSPNEISGLKRTNPKENFPYLKKSIELVRREIPDKALFGFAGAPFTLASYLLEGKSTRTALITKKFAYNNPVEFNQLLDFLADIVIDQLNCQIEGGVDIVQLFDSWAGFLSTKQYHDWILPHIQKICLAVTKVPLIIYGRGSSHLLPIFAKSGADGISIDGSVTLNEAKYWLNEDTVLQGNLDPALLQTSPKIVESETRKMLQNHLGNESRRYIFNLAQGIDKNSSLENVEAMVNAVKQFNSEVSNVN